MARSRRRAGGWCRPTDGGGNPLPGADPANRFAQLGYAVDRLAKSPNASVYLDGTLRFTGGATAVPNTFLNIMATTGSSGETYMPDSFVYTDVGQWSNASALGTNPGYVQHDELRRLGLEDLSGLVPSRCLAGLVAVASEIADNDVPNDRLVVDNENGWHGRDCGGSGAWLAEEFRNP